MQPDRMIKILPEIYQSEYGTGGALDAFLQAQHTLHAPCEAVLGNYANFFSPYRAPLPFVYMLAYWTGLDYLLDGPEGAKTFAPGDGRLRALIAVATHNIQHRGSKQALLSLLRTATGLTGFDVNQNLETPYSVIITAPQDARLHDALIRKIIDRETPAFVHCTLEYAGTDSITPTSQAGV